MSNTNNSFVSSINNNFYANPSSSVLDDLFREYQRVILRSIVTSFGLDLLIHDQYGGDVDTVHNVRSIGIDPQMKYKNSQNATAYDNRGDYSHKDVEGTGTNFQRTKHEARAKYMEDPRNNTVQDAYEDKPLGFLGKSKGHPTEKSAELDHVISAKNIHDDRGRVLAGISTVDLADAEDNLRWTNEHLNKSMKADEIPDYIAKHPELPEDTKARMMDAYNQAKASYENAIASSYYFDFSNPNCRQFYKDAALSAGKRGLEMGLRQALGFLFVELWFSVKDAISESDQTFDGVCKATADGLAAGLQKVTAEYKDIFAQFGEGLMSGILASITSTIINTFFTTSENAGRILRQAWASTVEATTILIFNNREQYLCDRMTSAAKVLATGASVIVGTLIQEEVSLKLKDVPIDTSLKNILSSFAGCLSTGFLSVSLLFYIDNGPYTKLLIEIYGEGNRKLQEQAVLFKQYCAELEKVDVKRLERDTNYIFVLSNNLSSANSANHMNYLLREAVSDLRLPSVFGGHSIDDRINDKNWVLKF